MSSSSISSSSSSSRSSQDVEVGICFLRFCAVVVLSPMLSVPRFCIPSRILKALETTVPLFLTVSCCSYVPVWLLAFLSLRRPLLSVSCVVSYCLYLCVSLSLFLWRAGKQAGRQGVGSWVREMLVDKPYTLAVCCVQIRSRQRPAASRQQIEQTDDS